jgi:hypothetical protein
MKVIVDLQQLNRYIVDLFVVRGENIPLHVPYANGWGIGFTGFKGSRDDHYLGAQWVAGKKGETKAANQYYESQIVRFGATPVVHAYTPGAQFPFTTEMWALEDLESSIERPIERVYYEVATSVRTAQRALFDQLGMPHDAQPIYHLDRVL